MLLTLVDILVGLLALFALLAFIFVAITYLVAFWIAPWLEFPTKPETRHLTGQRPPPGVFVAAFCEFFRSTALFSVYFGFPFYHGYQLNGNGGGQLPIIFVHGYGMTSTSWLFFLPMLARRGITANMVAIQYNWLRCIEQSATELKELVEKTLATYGGTQVDIVAHSWGGNIARWYIQKLGCAGKVRNLVMLEVPNQGSFSTAYAIGCPRRQLAIGSAVIKSLSDAPPYPPFSLTWSKCDQVAVPWEFLKLPKGHGGQVRNHEIFHSGHLSALMSRQCADFAANVLTGRTSSLPEEK